MTSHCVGTVQMRQKVG